uniref:Uncharacterized protein n=1 Tax=viral metagenome TaxID=1070528 RepID=A0A6C0KS27_9ZZZZ
MNSFDNQNKLSCIICNKKYTKKSSLDKHKILCEFKTKTKREIKIDNEEQDDIPTYSQLVKIVQESTLKMIKMEDKIIELEKWVQKKKKKLNVISWLNDNINPTIGFLEWVNVQLNVKEHHFENLMENTLFSTVQKIFEDNLSSNDDIVNPICCFTQKMGIFYICEFNEDAKPLWKQLVLNDMVLILKTIQNRLLKVLTKWKLDNQYKIEDNDKISELFNKAIIKLMNMSFNQDASLGRIKNNLFNYLKIDFKPIEFDLEF